MTHYTARVADDLRLELPEAALRFVRPGQEIDISLDENIVNGVPAPNEALLAMLRDLDVMKKNMPESDPSRTDQFIREARSGSI